MKVNKPLLLFCLVCLWVWPSLHAQSSYCKNLSFELGNFTNWTGYTWRYSTTVPSLNTNQVQGIADRRQTIMSDTAAYDANTGNALRKIPRGYMYSARLGDEINSSDRSPRCLEQSLRYTMTIDSSNALLILKFALVLQYAYNHPETDEPRFRLTLYDSRDSILPDCSNYDVYSSNKNVKGFKTYNAPGARAPVVWRDWTTVGANLLKYIGQTITIEFMSADCAWTFHYGYAYFVAECHPLYITVKYCASDTEAYLTAPEGFERYKWTNSSGTILDTLQILKVSVPSEKLSYSCTMTSATGCVVTLQTSLLKYIPHAEFKSLLLDCFSNKVQFINLSKTNHGALSYKWNFWEGITSSLSDPSYSFKSSGMHKVTLILSNPPSACKDTITRDVESFSPPQVKIVGDTTYCPGLSTWIKASGATEYSWSNGLKTDSIEVKAPGGKFWLMGRSTTGCISDTVRTKIKEEPEWPLVTNADTTLCGDRKVVLAASGAADYLWNKVVTEMPGTVKYLWAKGITGDSLVVSDPGSYLLSAANARGCKKSNLFNVSGFPIPAASFSISPDALDYKRTLLSCTLPAEIGSTYTWSMGDGSSEKGASIKHQYSVSNDLLFYKISLLAKNSHNCADSSFRLVDVIPFIPNVFTPNEDGINDLFMKGFQVEIVDRSGLQIFKGNNGWDGRHKGDPADPDTYFYLVTYRDSNEKIHSRKGYLTLVR